MILGGLTSPSRERPPDAVRPAPRVAPAAVHHRRPRPARPVPPCGDADADDPVPPGIGPAGVRQPQGGPHRAVDLAHAGRRRRARGRDVVLLARARLLGRHQHGAAAGPAPRPDGARRRLGLPLRRRLAPRPAPHPAAPAPARDRGRQRLPLLQRRRRAALRRPRRRRPARLHDLDVRQRRGGRRPPRPLQRAAHGRRRGSRPVGPAARLDDRGEHRRRDRQDGADLAAAQHAELPVPRGLGDGRSSSPTASTRRGCTSTGSPPGRSTTPRCSRGRRTPASTRPSRASRASPA